MPPELVELIDNVVIQIEDEPDLQTMRDLGLDPRRDQLFGLYTGIPLDERGAAYGAVLPDVILLYRRPLLAACRTRDELLREIQLTLLHELGHHFGLSDDEMEAWELEFETLEDKET
jgi:predicted Zn-dependent protease with MMP-like domain